MEACFTQHWITSSMNTHIPNYTPTLVNSKWGHHIPLNRTFDELTVVHSSRQIQCCLFALCSLTLGECVEQWSGRWFLAESTAQSRSLAEMKRFLPDKGAKQYWGERWTILRLWGRTGCSNTLSAQLSHCTFRTLQLWLSSTQDIDSNVVHHVQDGICKGNINSSRVLRGYRLSSGLVFRAIYTGRGNITFRRANQVLG